MKKFTKILALALVLVMGVCVLAGCGGTESKVEKSVKNFCDGMLDCNFEKAAKYVGDDGVKEEILEVAEMYEEDPDLKDEYLEEMAGSSYKIGDIDVDDDEATAEVTWKQDGEMFEQTFELEKIDGEWLIVNVEG